MNVDALAAQLVTDEGMRLKPYKDSVGKTTIGCGRNLDDVGISKAEAMAMLAADIDIAAGDLDKFLPWWRQMTDRRQQALCNMAFNLGITKLQTFKNTLAAMKAGDYKAAAIGMRASLWAKQVGARAERLATMMEEG